MIDHVTNPDALRLAVPDLTCGIPVHLWTGSDSGTRAWLLADYRRQIAKAAQQREAMDAKRETSLNRILTRSSPSPVTPAANLRHLQALLLEAAAVISTIAAPLPAGDPTDADAS